MKISVALLLLLVLILGAAAGVYSTRQCDQRPGLDPRPHSVSILEFGAVGDGKTLNTLAFQNAIFYLKSFADKGGAKLYVPPGRWLTGSINLTSHLTLFLEKGATILGSQDPSHWGVVDPLPSYGRGIELPGKRYSSLIYGDNLHDVVVTGDNGTIDGQGGIWWDWYNLHSLNYSRPHLVEFTNCDGVVISNLTFMDAPAFSIHPVYCRNVYIQNVSVSAPSDSPLTTGIVPDSSDAICIEESRIDVGYDAVSLKSGWDEYGLSYGRATRGVHLRRLHLQAHSGASLSFGSEMSGGISEVIAEDLHLRNSRSGIEFRTAKGRGGYMNEILLSSIEMLNVDVALTASGDWASHPDVDYDPTALPLVAGITLEEITGTRISTAGKLAGIRESPFTSICMFNVTLDMATSSSRYWECSDVYGYSENVSPAPCVSLRTAMNSSSCYFAEAGDGVSASL